jgi:hypothetical protein
MRKKKHGSSASSTSNNENKPYIAKKIQFHGNKMNQIADPSLVSSFVLTKDNNEDSYVLKVNFFCFEFCILFNFFFSSLLQIRASTTIIFASTVVQRRLLNGAWVQIVVDRAYILVFIVYSFFLTRHLFFFYTDFATLVVYIFQKLSGKKRSFCPRKHIHP